MIADDNLWHAVHCGVPGLLRPPLVRWCVRHRGMEDRSATQVQEEEYEHLAEPVLATNSIRSGRCAFNPGEKGASSRSRC